MRKATNALQIKYEVFLWVLNVCIVRGWRRGSGDETSRNLQEDAKYGEDNSDQIAYYEQSIDDSRG